MGSHDHELLTIVLSSLNEVPLDWFLHHAVVLRSADVVDLEEGIEEQESSAIDEAVRLYSLVDAIRSG